MARQGKRPLSFKAFLSHRYKSPEVNLYFFNIFSRVAEVQFEVDEGTFSTNVTRLERMIRDADAFIGIYPFPGSWEESQSIDELRKASRYFRLELDLAIRSRKPSIVFYDEKYRDLLRCPSTVLIRPFDSAEVTGAGGSPRAASYQETFSRFCEIVQRSMAYSVARESSPRTGIGLAVPTQPATPKGYDAEHVETLREILQGHGYEDIKILSWPPVLARDTFVFFQEVDWVAIDLGEEMAFTGIPAYLHGRFVPMLRLKRVGAPGEPKSLLERVLFGGIEVGYMKDTVEWDTKDSLREGVAGRLLSLGAKVRRINTAGEAEKYFTSAALRKEAVFLSYSGRDQDPAADLRISLEKKFQKVFDYRSREAIEPGQPWVQQVFDQLSSSAVGVPLLSAEYLKSGNCMHELEQMVALRDSQKMRLIPIKLYREELSLPSYMESIQYLRFSDYDNPNEITQAIGRFLE